MGDLPVIIPGVNVEPGGIESLVLSVGLWMLLLIMIAATTVWAVGYVRARLYTPPSSVFGGEDVQVRILTIDDEEVVQETVDAIPSELDDIHVVAEQPISVAGAMVHVVPDEFSCRATRKGRAIEWARRTLQCEREFVLYLDEDSVMTSFDGFPDADVVQLREQPVRTESRLTYFAEVFRMGFQSELGSFAKLPAPFYAWGGGLAVRKTVEDEVTWDRRSIVEDTAFVWRVATEDLDFEVVDAIVHNQAPPTFEAIFEQRRRWIGGAKAHLSVLPRWLRGLVWLRFLSWGLLPLGVLGLPTALLLGETLLFNDLYYLVGAALTGLALVGITNGLRKYRLPISDLLAFCLLLPITVYVHGAGGFWGFFKPPETFTLTEKVSPTSSITNDTVTEQPHHSTRTDDMAD